MQDLRDIAVKRIDGSPATIGDFGGKVSLIVNVASKCGLTPQYEQLEALYQRYADQGFVILGFPANNFLAQEPGTDAEISTFCSTEYNVTFPMFSKISVAGDDKHPLYDALTTAIPAASSANGNAMRERLESHNIPVLPQPEVLWNFEKFLVGKDGAVLARFSPDTTPDDPALVKAVETALAAD